MGKKSNKIARGKPTDPLFIDEAGLVRYGAETPPVDLDDETHLLVRAVEGSESGLQHKSRRTRAEGHRLILASSLLIDWMLETYTTLNDVKPGLDDNGVPGVL